MALDSIFIEKCLFLRKTYILIKISINIKEKSAVKRT